jgi:hypothetical protein
MPIIKRRQFSRRDWGPIHRIHLRDGALAPWQQFGERLRVTCRKREGDTDFEPRSMPLAEAAWRDLADELLASVKDPSTIWAFRRFGPCRD